MDTVVREATANVPTCVRVFFKGDVRFVVMCVNASCEGWSNVKGLCTMRTCVRVFFLCDLGLLLRESTPRVTCWG